MCTICNHAERAEIENAILAMSMSKDFSIESIAEQYNVDLNDLKMHALFHTPLGGVPDLPAPDADAETRDSLTRRIKLREADILASVNNEYLVTLKTMGRRINRLAQVSCIDEEDADKQVVLAKLLTKPMVDLYVSLGGEIRQNVKAMAEIDRMLNGAEDSASSGLVALAKVLQGSGPSDD